MLLPEEEEDEASNDLRRRRREEEVRRAQLYGVSSRRHLPKVNVPQQDARTRKELQILMEPQQLVGRDGLSVYEDELEQRKYHEQLGIRPALDQSHPLHDLYTTVPRQIRQLTGDKVVDSTAKHAREWRLGYRNDPQSDFHGLALRGVFEPSDATRERLVESATHDVYRQTSTALVYPVPFTSADKVAQRLDPYDAEQARNNMEAKLAVGTATMSPSRKKHWTPASLTTKGFLGKPTKHTPQKQRVISVDQQFAVRDVTGPLSKVGLSTDGKCVQAQQEAAHHVNESYATIQRQAVEQKDPTVRYSLPIENPKYERAYRLGLDSVPSSPAGVTGSPSRPEFDDGDLEASPSLSSAGTSTKTPKKQRATKPPLLFRPKSAVSLRMDTTMPKGLARSSSSASLLMRNEPSSKVAGAKRRPHSATLSYLSNSTVYCMETASTASTRRSGAGKPSNATANGEDLIAAALAGNAHEVLKQQRQLGASFLTVIMQERARRQKGQAEKLDELARRGVLHTIPMPQIFARLRREALKNLTKRVEYARYEKLPLDDYMSICGMAVLPEPATSDCEELQESDDRGDDDEEEAPEDGGRRTPAKEEIEDPVVQALRDELELRQLPFDEPAHSVFRKRCVSRPDPVDGNNSSTVRAMRIALFVTREQFHIALEAFAVATRDVNGLFSALDVSVDDRVALWEIICAVERLQDGHQEIRRSRLPVKARDLPKDLERLRRSVSFPHRTHVPLPIAGL